MEMEKNRRGEEYRELRKKYRELCEKIKEGR